MHSIDMHAYVVCGAGTKRVKYLEENVAAASIQLTDEDKQQLEAVFASDQVCRLCLRLRRRWWLFCLLHMSQCESLAHSRDVCLLFAEFSRCSLVFWHAAAGRSVDESQLSTDHVMSVRQWSVSRVTWLVVVSRSS